MMQVSDVAEYFTDSILGVWEEGLKSVVRETFNNGTRFANTFSTWCLKVLGKEVGGDEKGDKTKAWRSWWQENRQSSLNAFIASHSPSKRQKPRESFTALSSAEHDSSSRTHNPVSMGKVQSTQNDYP